MDIKTVLGRKCDDSHIWISGGGVATVIPDDWYKLDSVGFWQLTRCGDIWRILRFEPIRDDSVEV